MKTNARPLWKITVLTTEEAQDAVSELLARTFGQPVSIYVDMETRGASVAVYLTKLAKTSSTLKAVLAGGLDAIHDLGLDVAPATIQIRKLAPENWAESWKRHFKPIEIGDALLIKPSWNKRRPRKGQSLVVLDPGLSFGTGQHATTSFCLNQLAANRDPSRKQSLLDIGSGSGILAICAAKLGYAPVEAFDFDPEAVRVSRENASNNGVGDTVSPVRKDLTKLPLKAARQYDLVCANLMHDLLISQAEKICARLKPGGRLILAGILATQFPLVLKAFEKQGFRQGVTRVEKEWQSVELERVSP